MVILVPSNPVSVTTQLSCVHSVLRVQSMEVARVLMSFRARQVGPYWATTVGTQRKDEADRQAEMSQVSC